jgi:outer membrane protein assembly factor BamB
MQAAAPRRSFHPIDDVDRFRRFIMLHKPLPLLLLCFAVAGLLAVRAPAGEWRGFRGTDGTGISKESHVPLTWGPDKNIKWKTPLPGEGNSSPIVSGGRVFLTCATEGGKNRGLYCYDRATGKERWTRNVRFEGDDPTHASNPYCGSSPATDGRRVVVWHGSAGLVCYDLDGNEFWKRDLGECRHIWGYGSSPVFYGDSVLLNFGPGKRTFVTAIDAANGKTIWQTDEPGGDSGEEKDPKTDRALWLGSWSTPLVAKVDGHDQVIVSMPRHVRGYDPKTGDILWSCDGLGDLAYTSVLTADGIGVAMGGFMGPALGWKLGGSGDVTATNRLWLVEKGNPQRIGSGVIVGNHVYIANESGVVHCLELATGKKAWEGRLGGEKIWSSTIAADGRLYVSDQKGTTYVFAPNPEKLEILAKNELGEPTNSTLAISDGQIFLRTFGNLYCVEEK